MRIFRKLCLSCLAIFLLNLVTACAVIEDGGYPDEPTTGLSFSLQSSSIDYSTVDYSLDTY